MDENESKDKPKDKPKWNSPATEKALMPYRWKRGQSGNPAGNKRGHTLKTRLKNLLKQDYEMKCPFSEQMEIKELGEWIAMKLVGKALKEDTKAIEMIFDRTEGPVQKAVKEGNTESEDIAEFKKRIREKAKKLNTDNADTL